MSDNEEKRGPKEDRVKINIPWEDALKKALKKERPKEGWPEEKKKEERKNPDRA